MKHHYNKEELVELKRKYDMQIEKEELDGLCQDCFRYSKVQDRIDTLEKTIEYAKRIEKDYKIKFDKAIKTIENLIDDSEDEDMYQITKSCKEWLIEELTFENKQTN